MDCPSLRFHEPGHLVCIPVSHLDNAALSWRLHASCFYRGRWTDVLPRAALYLDVNSDATLRGRVYLGKSNPLSPMGPRRRLGPYSSGTSVVWRLHILGRIMGVQYGVKSISCLIGWISLCNPSIMAHIRHIGFRPRQSRGRNYSHNILDGNHV